MGNCSSQEQSLSSPNKIQQPELSTPFVKPQECVFVLSQHPPAPAKKYGKKGIKSHFCSRSGYEPDAELNKALKDQKRFSDHVFKHEKKSIGDKLHIDHLEWKRVNDFGKEEPVFFLGDMETLDLKTGRIQNNYYVSCWAALSHTQDYLQKTVTRIFNKQLEYSHKGAHGIWLFIDGDWKCIVIDDLVPIAYGEYPFTRYLNESWIILIEKALAKVYKSYQNIQYGLLGHCLTTLTGAPSFYLCQNSQKMEDPENIWQCIKQGIQNNYIVTISTQLVDKNKYLGKESTFSYSVLDCQEVYILTTTKKKRQRIVKLDNCWGRYEWKGRWSEYSDVWSEELRHQLGYEKADQSIIWINIQDMLSNFGQVCICKYNPQFLNSSLELTFSEQPNDLKGVFLHIHQRTEGTLSLYQKDYRHFFKDYQYSMCRLILMQLDKDGKPTHIAAETSDCDFVCHIEQILDPGIYYLLIQMDWKCSFTRNATLTFYADVPVHMQVDPKMPSIDSIFYQLCKMDQENPKKVQIHTYPDDPNIKRVRGEFAGYIYFHYSNNSTDNKFLNQCVNLKNCKNLQAVNEKNPNKYSVKLNPGQQKLIKIKIKKDGNGYYEYKPIIENRMFEKYSSEDLLQMLRKRPTSLRRRQIDGEKVDVFIKMFEYSGGVALLYENRMEKNSFIEDIIFELKNLTLDNQNLDQQNKFSLQLEPDSQKLFSFLVIDPSNDYVFKTKVSYYLSTPEFKF